MRRTLLALVALSRSVHLLAQLHTAATMLRINTDKENLKIANKSLEFVKLIRENLRRNNDDYALLERQKLLTSRPKSAITYAHLRRATAAPPASRLYNRNRIMPSIRPPEQHIQSKPPLPKRRAQLARQPPLSGQLARQPPLSGQLARQPPLSGQLARQPPLSGQLARQPSLSAPLPARGPGSFRGPLPDQPAKMSINARRGLNMTQNITSESVEFPNITQFRSYTHSKHYKKVRIDKLKRLVDKEKDKLRNKGRTVTDDAQATTPPATTVPKLPTVPTPRPSPPPRLHGNNTQATLASPSPPPTPLTTTWRPPGHNLPTNFEQQQQQAALRQLAESQSPSPEQLDMAPARGQEITLYRFKGRLCQRSLMNIEGPAYDKVGKMVMPAHDPKRFRREFHQTRAPMLLLPRCCNCCKKSVLGCQ